MRQKAYWDVRSLPLSAVEIVYLSNVYAYWTAMLSCRQEHPKRVYLARRVHFVSTFLHFHLAIKEIWRIIMTQIALSCLYAKMRVVGAVPGLLRSPSC